ncbi:MAG: UbiA family prenyltransferase [Paracoccaceae bacterium]
MAMNLRTLLILGRVSNLPTVWTNALAGTVLSMAVPPLSNGGMGLLLLSLSLFYVGGMYLNDAFDAEIDAAERASRPIPTGKIGQSTVFLLGFGMLGLGAVLGFLFSMQAGLAGLGLAASVIAYDWLHKKTAAAPLLMGACRFLTYVMAALAAGELSDAVLIGAVGLFAHTVGLTYAAKQEAYDRIERVWPLAVLALPAIIGAWMAYSPFFWNLPAFVLLGIYVAWTLWALTYLFRRGPGDVPRAVVSLIAGIALFDAVVIAAVGASLLAVFAVLGFLLTLALQRFVPGT